MATVIKTKKPAKPRNPKANPKDPVVAPAPEPDPTPTPEPAPVETEETPVTDPTPVPPAPDPAVSEVPAAPVASPKPDAESGTPANEGADAPTDTPTDDPHVVPPNSQPIKDEPDHYTPGPDLEVAGDQDSIAETDPADAEYPKIEATIDAVQPVPPKQPDAIEPEDPEPPEGFVKVRCTSKRGVFHSSGPMNEGDESHVSPEDADILTGLGVAERI